MRGGAIPLLAWGTLNLALLGLNWIWEGTGIHVAEFGFAVLVLYLAGLVVILRGRHAVRPGPPAHLADPDPLPRASFAAAGIGLAVGVALFGLVFGAFLIVIGGVLFVLSTARLAQEVRWERRTVTQLERERRP